MARVAIEVGTRSQGYAPNHDKFQRALPAVVFEAVSALALEHGVVLRSIQVIERKSKAR